MVGLGTLHVSRGRASRSPESSGRLGFNVEVCSERGVVDSAASRETGTFCKSPIVPTSEARNRLMLSFLMSLLRVSASTGFRLFLFVKSDVTENAVATRELPQEAGNGIAREERVNRLRDRLPASVTPVGVYSWDMTGVACTICSCRMTVTIRQDAGLFRLLRHLAYRGDEKSLNDFARVQSKINSSNNGA